MNEHEAIERFKQQVKSLSSHLEMVDYQNSLLTAEQETGYTLPLTDNTKIYWLMERAKRALFFILLTESAHKFKVKQYNLQHQFEHYRSIIEYMDKVWAEYLLSAEAMIDVAGEEFRLFGTKIDAGFQYDEVTGRDTTYTEDNEVIFSPNESD